MSTATMRTPCPDAPSLDSAVIKRMASGQWEAILASLAPDLRPAIDKATGKTPRHVACPGHGGSDGFRLFNNWRETGGAVCNTCGKFGDGFALLMWLHSYGFAECLRDVAGSLGIGGAGRTAMRVRRKPLALVKPAPNECPDAAKRIDRTLADAHLLDLDVHHEARLYFESRGLGEIVGDRAQWPALRFAQSLKYWQDNGKYLAAFPAILGVVESLEGETVSIHRTYLAAAGRDKANVEKPKKLMRAVRDGATSGAAIRLYPATERLALSEGIETSLAVRLATGWPVWACVSAGGLRAIRLPPSVREASIWADNDVSQVGQQAAKALADRLVAEGRTVRVVIPPQPGTDWLDVLASGGVA